MPNDTHLLKALSFRKYGLCVPLLCSSVLTASWWQHQWRETHQPLQPSIREVTAPRAPWSLARGKRVTATIRPGNNPCRRPLLLPGDTTPPRAPTTSPPVNSNLAPSPPPIFRVGTRMARLSTKKAIGLFAAHFPSLKHLRSWYKLAVSLSRRPKVVPCKQQKWFL